MRWFGPLRASARPAPPLPDDEALAALELLALLDEAVSHVAPAELLLERCAAGRLGAPDARAALALRVKFTQLSRWVEGMPCPADHLLLRDEAACLLRYYLLMVTFAVESVFVPAGRRPMPIRGGQVRAAASMTALRDALRDAVEA